MTFDFEFAFRFPAAIILIVYSKLTQELTNKLTKKTDKIVFRGQRAACTLHRNLDCILHLNWAHEEKRELSTESWIKYWHYAVSKLIGIFIVSRGEASCHPCSHHIYVCCFTKLTRSSSEELIVTREGIGVQRCNAVTIILITMIFSNQQNTNKMIINTQTAVRDKNGFKTFLWQSTNHSNDHKRKKEKFKSVRTFRILMNIFFRWLVDWHRSRSSSLPCTHTSRRLAKCQISTGKYLLPTKIFLLWLTFKYFNFQ